MKILFLCVLILSTASLTIANDNPLWASRYSGITTGIDEVRGMVIDNSGNTYITGRSQGSGLNNNYDIATIKYNQNGDSVWVERFDGGGMGLPVDEPHDIAVDNLGNVYVAGFSTGQDMTSDFITIKYNSIGDTVWVRRLTGDIGINQIAYSLDVDGIGNVYVTGTGGGNYLTVSYNSNGDFLWSKTYNGIGNDFDAAYKLKIKNGFLYVTGISRSVFGSSISADYLTIKYTLTGDSVWIKRYNGTGNNYDEPEDMFVDNSGNVYVTGFSRNTSSAESADYLTIKYSSTGDSLWVRRYNGTVSGLDESKSIAVDNSGNVYVTGRSVSGNGYDYATIKYSSLGVEEWIQRYNGQTFNSFDEANDLALDRFGNVYVTGTSQGMTMIADYVTIRYSPQGTMQWLNRYNSPANREDAAYFIAVDSLGFVYVSGNSVGSNLVADFLTMKIDKTTNIEPVNSAIPDKFSLNQNYPNPFNPETKIKFQISNSSEVMLTVFDNAGREVAILVNQFLKAGNYEFNFNAKGLSSGIYFYRLSAENFSETKKMILIK
ncbi:MAG: SBBP repeat-containing protein [Ignavibacteria bacterium]|nr:SBBP repeat-containing protein [Ignavibacteria bacterium]